MVYGQQICHRAIAAYRTPYFDNDLVALAYQTPATLLQMSHEIRLIADGDASVGKDCWSASG